MGVNWTKTAERLAWAGVPLLAFALFAAGITDGHLGADDWGYTCGCPFVRDGLSWANVRAAFADPAHGAIWMPLTYVTYMADISLFGGGWPVHHAVNVALHAVNAGLALAFLLAVVRRLLHRAGREASRGRTVAACALGALVWALHPMRAEAVTYIASRKEELWTLFALLGALGWMRYQERGGVRRALGVLAAFACSCLSKPTALCVPFLCLALQTLLFDLRARRARLALPMLAGTALVGLLAVHSQMHPTGMASAEVFPATLGWRLLNAAVSTGLYLWHAVAPSGIHLDYRAVFGGWPVDGLLGLGALAAAALASAAALLFCRGRLVRPVILFAWGWFLLGLMPTLGVFGYVNGDQAAADRYTYLPALALSLPVALVLARSVASGRRAPRLAWAAALALSAAEALAALPVIRSFRDDYAAFSRTLARDPDHWRALRIVGNEYCARRGRMDEGVRMLRRSLRERGSQQTADSLAYVLSIRGAEGDFDEVRRLGAAIRREPRLDRGGMMLDALGVVCMRERDYAEAVRLLQAAVGAPRRTHALGHSLLNLALSMANVGRTDEALLILDDLAASGDHPIARRAEVSAEAIRSGTAGEFGWR